MIEADTYNLGTAKIGATEAVNEFSTLGLKLLLLVSVNDVGQAALNLVIIIRALINKTLETLPSKIDLITSDSILGRLRSKIC